MHLSSTCLYVHFSKSTNLVGERNRDMSSCLCVGQPRVAFYQTLYCKLPFCVSRTTMKYNFSGPAYANHMPDNLSQSGLIIYPAQNVSPDVVGTNRYCVA